MPNDWMEGIRIIIDAALLIAVAVDIFKNEIKKITVQCSKQ